jgi:hypothetical protein
VRGRWSIEERSERKMEYRREECKEDGWSTEESSRRKIEYTREEWGVDGVRQKREEIEAYTVGEECKEGPEYLEI